MTGSHAMQALRALCGREVVRFVQQRARLASAVVRPSLWLLVFAAGFHNAFGVSIVPPYQTYIEYQVYVVPGLVAMVLLFNGMQSSLAMVYDREMGLMRLLLTAPLPRWFLLLAKLLAGALLSVLQAYAFLGICLLFGIDVPVAGLITVLPAMVLAALMLAAVGLLLSVHIRQLENFAGTMNFVIFPMFFISPALYPLWRLQESGAEVIHQIARFNPFTHAVDLVRFALYGELNLLAAAVVTAWLAACYLLSVLGYDPQRGLVRLRRQAG